MPSSPRWLTQSVEQNGVAPVRTTTRPGVGSSSSISSTTKGCLSSARTAARIAQSPTWIPARIPPSTQNSEPVLYVASQTMCSIVVATSSDRPKRGIG